MLYSKFNLEDALAVSKEEGIEIGIGKGVEKTTIKFAQKALLRGDPIEEVSIFFGLDEKIINEIKNLPPDQVKTKPDDSP
jgi:hypothetical protein